MAGQCRVFISVRFSEALEEALALKQCLDDNGIPTFVCALLPGANLLQTIASELEHCELVVVMGTSTYGFKTDSHFCTYQELQYIMTQRKPFFLVKMCDRFNVPSTTLQLTNDIAYFPWTAGTAMPSNIVQSIQQKLAGNDCPVGQQRDPPDFNVYFRAWVHHWYLVTSRFLSRPLVLVPLLLLLLSVGIIGVVWEMPVPANVYCVAAAGTVGSDKQSSVATMIDLRKPPSREHDSYTIGRYLLDLPLSIYEGRSSVSLEGGLNVLRYVYVALGERYNILIFPTVDMVHVNSANCIMPCNRLPEECEALRHHREEFLSTEPLTCQTMVNWIGVLRKQGKL